MKRFMSVWIAVVAVAIPLAAASAADCAGVPGDVTGDGQANVSDVQCTIVTNLWTLAGSQGATPACLLQGSGPADINCDSTVDVSDVVLAIGLVLGLPLPSDLDADGNLCADACAGGPTYALENVRLVPAGAVQMQSSTYRIRNATGEWIASPPSGAQSGSYTLRIP